MDFALSIYQLTLLQYVIVVNEKQTPCSLACGLSASKAWASPPLNPYLPGTEDPQGKSADIFYIAIAKYILKRKWFGFIL